MSDVRDGSASAVEVTQQLHGLQSAKVDALESQMASMEQRLGEACDSAELIHSLDESVTDLDAKLAALTASSEASRVSVPTQSSGDPAPADAASHQLHALLSAKVDALESQLTEFMSDAGDSVADLDVKLEESVTDLDAKLAALAASSEASRVSVPAQSSSEPAQADAASHQLHGLLSAKVDTLESQLTEFMSDAGDSVADLDVKLEAAVGEWRSSALAQSSDAGPDPVGAISEGEPPAGIAALDQRIQALEAQIQSNATVAPMDTELLADQRLQVATVQASLGGLEAKMQQVEQNHSQAQQATEAAMDALKMSVQAQVAGLQDGGSHEGEGAMDESQVSALVESLVEHRFDTCTAQLKGLGVGDRCEVSTESCAGQGFVAFIGRTSFKDGVWVGVELDQPDGKNDGSVQGRRYFTCADKHGVMTQPENVRKVSTSETVSQMLAAKKTAQEKVMVALRDEVKKLNAVQTAAVASLEGRCTIRCDDIEGSVRACSGRIGTDSGQLGSQLQALKQRVDGVQGDVTELNQSLVESISNKKKHESAAVGTLEQLAEVQAQLTELAADMSLLQPEAVDSKITTTVTKQLISHREQLESQVQRWQMSEQSLLASVDQTKADVAAANATVADLNAVGDDCTEQLQAQLQAVDQRLGSRIELASHSFDAGQDAYEKRIDALESWLRKVEEKVGEGASTRNVESVVTEIRSSVSSLTGSMSTQAIKMEAMESEVRAAIALGKDDQTQLLRKLANGIKAEIDAIKTEMEATESKVLGFLKRHTELSEQNSVGREEYDEFVSESLRRTSLVEDRIDMTLAAAETKASETELSVVALKQQYDDAHIQAQKKQEPLSIRVPSVLVRTDPGTSKS